MQRSLVLSFFALALVACTPSTDTDGGNTNTDGDGGTEDDGGAVGDGDGDGDRDGSDAGSPGCVYPQNATTVPTGIGDVMPNISWGTVTFPNGRQGPLSMEDIYCGEDYADYETVTFIVVTTWCPNCPSYVQQIGTMQGQLRDNNSLLVFLVMQNSQYGRANATIASQYITGYLGENAGIRVGDLETEPAGSLDGIYSFIPNGFVVRTSDMEIIAHQETAGGFVPYVQVAADPTADWSSGLAPFQSNCEEGDEEASEPNNSPAEAATVGFGEFNGGICDQSPDIYFIDVEGDWQLDLLFTHAVGDLDVHKINESGESQGEPAWSTTDNETMTGTGPQLIAVVGYTGASAPYTFVLTQP